MQKQRYLVDKILYDLKYVLFAVVFISLSTPFAKAQVLDLESETTATFETEESEDDSFIDFDAEFDQFAKDDESSNQQQVSKPQKPVDNITTRALAQKNNVVKKTKDNKEVSVQKIQKIKPLDPDEKIYLYMRDFSISKTISGTLMCDVTFYAYSTIKENINNISYRLKWPQMETALSFNNIETKKPTSINYTLLGEGCYSMDTPPNIIVNRCRIKGRTQKECASAIQWSK